MDSMALIHSCYYYYYRTYLPSQSEWHVDEWQRWKRWGDRNEEKKGSFSQEGKLSWNNKVHKPSMHRHWTCTQRLRGCPKMRALCKIHTEPRKRKNVCATRTPPHTRQDPPCPVASSLLPGDLAVVSSWWNLWTLSLTKTGSSLVWKASVALGEPRSAFCIKLSIWATSSAWALCIRLGLYLWLWAMSLLWPSSLDMRDKRSPAQTDKRTGRRGKIGQECLSSQGKSTGVVRKAERIMTEQEGEAMKSWLYRRQLLAVSVA